MSGKKPVQQESFDHPNVWYMLGGKRVSKEVFYAWFKKKYLTPPDSRNLYGIY